jgi:hypothetical protein
LSAYFVTEINRQTATIIAAERTSFEQSDDSYANILLHNGSWSVLLVIQATFAITSNGN